VINPDFRRRCGSVLELRANHIMVVLTGIMIRVEPTQWRGGPEKEDHHVVGVSA
jgi:hypothetical protein